MSDNLEPICRRVLNKVESSHLKHHEWLVANGLGGYASGTVMGPPSRRYHGLLVAALPAPIGRLVMLNDLQESLRFDDNGVIEFRPQLHLDSGVADQGTTALTEFRLEDGLPVWCYKIRDAVIEKRVFLPHMQNTVFITYRLLSDIPVWLRLRPHIHFRKQEEAVNQEFDSSYTTMAWEDRYEISGKAGNPHLRMKISEKDAVFVFDHRNSYNLFYQIEASRGYPAAGALWSPGYFEIRLQANDTTNFIASSEEWAQILALSPTEALAAELTRRRLLIAAAPGQARHGLGAELVLAADQFIIMPAGRADEATRAKAEGDDVRTVIAGYHWFTDWGRDTMISLEGLTLSTGRYAEAGYILRTFAHYVQDGLIPNLFPEGQKKGLYHTADATLWFFHALDRYLTVTNDRNTLRLILPKLIDIIDHHLRGTHFGIGVDCNDGLLRQGQQGYQLTWMDAKVGDWVVTPRRGKAVELNALWYNALRLLENWIREEQNELAATYLTQSAHQAYESFNRRFWFEAGGYLYDVIDGESGDDPACRPNQLLAISLKYPVLERSHWENVIDVVSKKLLTPYGLRSLAPEHPDYKPRYDGDLRARDAAYHQGTVWAWLIGPFIDAWIKTNGDDPSGARKLLKGFNEHLDDACVGSISEIFDAEPPYMPRGCVAQAWSVAEVLRCWIKTAISS